MADDVSRTTAEQDEIINLRHALNAATSEVDRLRIENKELRASRDAWSSRALAAQKALTERMCK